MDCSQSKTSKLAGDVIFVLNLPTLAFLCVRYVKFRSKSSTRLDVNSPVNCRPIESYI